MHFGLARNGDVWNLVRELCAREWNTVCDIQNEFGQFPEASDRVFALNKYKRNKKNWIIKGGINIDFD